MKILITTEQYHPIKSGVSTVVTAIAEELVRLKHKVYVATECKERSSAVHNGVNIIEFKMTLKPKRNFYILMDFLFYHIEQKIHGHI